MSRKQKGMTLLELTLATAIGALLLGGMHALVGLALDSSKEGHRVNELAYQGQFALDRIAEKVRAMPPPYWSVSTPLTGTTGDWFTPTMYCRNATSKKLIETNVADTTCSGTGVIAENVSAFTAVLPAMGGYPNKGPIDRHSAIVVLTLDDNAGHSLTLSMQLRMGGGVQ